MSWQSRGAREAIATIGLMAAMAVALTACTGSSSPASPSSAAGTLDSAAPPGSSSPAALSRSPAGSVTSSTGSSGPPSSSGSTSLHVVPTVPVTTLPAEPLTSPASFGTGVRVRISSVTHAKVTGTGRGVFTGHPTVVFHLLLSNQSARTVNVNNVQVNATYGRSATPAVPATNTSIPFAGSLAPGARARATYAFAVPPSGQGRVEVTVTYRQGTPTVLLRGSAR